MSRTNGNPARRARGSIVVDGARLDLRNIEVPIVVFASWGDNITPPPQALNWIIDTWGDERAITAAGRIIVYVLHDASIEIAAATIV